MKNIFVSGATGVLGKRVVKLLLDDGFEVTGLSRSEENTIQLKELGAKTKQASIFDVKTLIKATENCDVIMHLATAIPTENIPKKPQHWAMNDKIRIEGTKALLKAARTNKIDCFIQQSITRVYGDRNGEEVSSATPVGENLPFMLKSAIKMEELVRNEPKIDHLILRFGQFYSADSVTTQQLMEGIRNRKMPIVGKGDYYWNYIHADDAARAVVYGLKRFSHLKNQTLNFTDFEPVTSEATLTELARITGSKAAYQIPGWLARIILSNDLYKAMTASYKIVQDEQIRDWKPVYKNFMEGMRQIMKQRNDNI